MSLTAHERNTLVAALGPTNTGKTHRAVERMLEHDTGMIGLPLRLLAREIYDRVTARLGEGRVALVTGEEKRVPAHPSYWVCTTEAMPVDREVDFVAVDEIQLAAHPERGHVFTDRLLHARGRRETWFMGSDTMRGLVEQLVPTAILQAHPRFSSLTSAGSMALSSLPARTAVVAFTAPQVYEIAERLRARRGGAAVVLGALSPRARNAQVALYQSGEVQYLVATDAIGMGLNMDVDLVAFAAVRKFDGREVRALEPAELAQIAGRAGRHLRDGRFGTLAPLPPLADDVLFALETHRFAPVQRIYWRNSELDLSSIDALVASLHQRPARANLRRVESAEDLAALERLALVPEIRARAQGPEAVGLLWEVCRIPDYRQLLAESHARLLHEIFLQLAARNATLDPDWMHERIARLDDTQGDIETLMGRIAFIRTWTYVANRGAWVRDERHWQELTRQTEDRLSDALHERLVQRFVAPGRGGNVRRASRRRAGIALRPIGQDTTAPVEGPFKALAALKIGAHTAASDASATDEAQWAARLVDAPHEAFRLDDAGKILWEGSPIARMTAGVDVLRPDVALQLDGEYGPGARARIERRLVAYTRDFVHALLAPLREPSGAGLSPAGRGLVYQLELGLGTALVRDAREQLRTLVPQDWRLLRKLEVRVGRRVAYVPGLLTEDAIRRRRVLVAVTRGAVLQEWIPIGAPGALRAPDGVDEKAMMSVGYPVFGGMAIRADVVERLIGVLSARSKQQPFALPESVPGMLGCGPQEAALVVQALGFVPGPDGWRAAQRGRSRRRQRRSMPLEASRSKAPRPARER